MFRPTAPALGGEELTSTSLLRDRGVDLASTMRTEVGDVDPMLTYKKPLAAADRDVTKPFIPEFVKLSQVVLRFSAHIVEPSHAVGETTRVRRFFIDYFVVDKSVAVFEPPVENSGLPQGTFLRRHAYKTPEGRALEPEDFSVGGAVVLYSRTFQIDGCNAVTRRFYEERGITMAENLRDIPEDSYIASRTTVTEATCKKTHRTKVVEDDKLAKFINHDRVVLRFSAVWEDKDRVEQHLRYLTLHYYLADDSLEAVEQLPPNSGRDSFPSFFKKQRVPFRPSDATGTAVSLDEIEHAERYVAPSDIHLGEYLDVFGRKLFVYDCDSRTRHLLIERFSRTEAETERCENEAMRLDAERHAVKHSPPRIPPNTSGFGTEADSMQSCIRLYPTPPKKDHRRLATFDGVAVRFKAHMLPKEGRDSLPGQLKPGDVTYVVTFYPSDLTISVFDATSSCKFFERREMLHPEGRHFHVRDFRAGNALVLNGFRFKLIEGDQWLEEHFEELLAKEASLSQSPTA
jgi:hypothetical protein